MMNVVKYEKNVCSALNIPSIPLKEWDGKTSFDSGVALVERITGDEEYAICSFSSEIEESVHIVKDFGHIPFSKVIKVFPVPAYMDDNIENMDLDDDSKLAIESLISQKKEIVNEGVDVPKEEVYEWGYPFIKDRQAAIAFLKDKKLKGRIPTSDDVLKSKLKVMYHSENHKK